MSCIICQGPTTRTRKYCDACSWALFPCGHMRTARNTVGPSPGGFARCRECKRAYAREYERNQRMQQWRTA